MTENKQNQGSGKCSDWKAWIDAMPPGRRLYVQGQCVYPTGGWEVTLKRAESQGINPFILILAKTATPPHGQATQQVTTYTPKYEERLDDGVKYEQVTIVPDNVTVDVKVIS